MRALSLTALSRAWPGEKDHRGLEHGADNGEKDRRQKSEFDRGGAALVAREPATGHAVEQVPAPVVSASHWCHRLRSCRVQDRPNLRSRG